MELTQIKQRKQREFESFETGGDIINILKSQFANRKLYIKYAVSKTEIKINEYLDDNNLMVVTDPTYEQNGVIVVYGLSDKFIEVDLEVVEERGPGYYFCRIKSARRAVTGRRDLRFKVNPDEVVATNFRVSKHTIDITGFKVPTSIKVVLDQFQSSNSRMSDIVKVDVFGSDDSNALLTQVKKTGKTLLISDVSNEEFYTALTDDFLDLRELYGKDLKLFIKKNVEKGYKSIIIVPIIYITEDEKSVPFGYIQLVSKKENFDIEKVLELKEHTFKLVDRIRDANTLLITTHQQLVDISRGGAKIKITDPNLKKSIIKSKGFIFDIVFKLQAPITIYGEVKVTYVDDFDELFIGVDFEGNSSRKDEMKRFYAILKPMEVEYKAKLIKQLKGGKK